MNKCPKCELNYKQNDEPYCSICSREMQGKDDTSEFDVCIICGSSNVIEGGSLCESCLNKKRSIEDRDEDDYDIDGYSDLIDTEIPECDLESIGEDLDDYDEQDDFDEE